MAGCVTWCGYPALYLRGYSAKKEVPMNKDEMVNILSQRTGFMKKDSEVMLDAVFQIITEALAAGEVLYDGSQIRFKSRTLEPLR